MSFNYPIAIPWIIFSGVIVATTIFLTIVTLILKHREESAKVPVIVTVLGLLAICFCLILIPVDIFNISQQQDPAWHGKVIKWVYYGSYLTLLVFAFVLIPFAYFFFEEGDEEQPLKWRLFHTMKYTIFTIAAGLLLIILALVLRFGSTAKEDKWAWIKNIVDYNNFGDRSIGFMVAVLALIGLIVFNIYTAYGLAALPISLMKRNRQVYMELSDIQGGIDDTQEKLRILTAKYDLSGQKMNRKDRLEHHKLKMHLHDLQRKSRKLDQVKAGWKIKIEPFIYPIKFLIGCILFLVTVLVMASLIISQIDRAIYSDCGIKCGFILNKTHPWNPLDRILTYSSIAFPVDYILFGLFIALIMLASVVGLSNIGIRFLCIKLYKIKYRRTMPQGLLTGCIFLMFIITVFSFSLISFAPQYVTFGSQKYQSAATGKWLECDMTALYNGTSPIYNTTIQAYESEFDSEMDNFVVDSNDMALDNLELFGKAYIGRPCYMSQLATIVNSVALRVPVFSVIFYFANWVFVAMYALFFVIALFRKPAAILNAEDSDDEMDDDDMDLRSVEKEPIARKKRSAAVERIANSRASTRYSTNYDI